MTEEMMIVYQCLYGIVAFVLGAFCHFVLSLVISAIRKEKYESNKIQKNPRISNPAK